MRAAAGASPWEASLQQAAAALAARKAAMQRRLAARAPREARGWKAAWWLVSHPLVRPGMGDGGIGGRIDGMRGGDSGKGGGGEARAEGARALLQKIERRCQTAVSDRD